MLGQYSQKEIWIDPDMLNFQHLNEACPNDDSSVPHTYLLVDTTSYKAFMFMDKYSGYKQIKMHPEDKEMIGFRSPKGVFSCYEFDLKNTEATYKCTKMVILRKLLAISLSIMWMI